jgi:hypothetical protein
VTNSTVSALYSLCTLYCTLPHYYNLHHTIQYTLHYTIHYTIHYTLHYTLHYTTLHLTLHLSLQVCGCEAYFLSMDANCKYSFKEHNEDPADGGERLTVHE